MTYLRGAAAERLMEDCMEEVLKKREPQERGSIDGRNHIWGLRVFL